MEYNLRADNWNKPFLHQVDFGHGDRSPKKRSFCVQLVMHGIRSGQGRQMLSLWKGQQVGKICWDNILRRGVQSFPKVTTICYVPRFRLHPTQRSGTQRIHNHLVQNHQRFRPLSLIGTDLDWLCVSSMKLVIGNPARVTKNYVHL